MKKFSSFQDDLLEADPKLKMFIPRNKLLGADGYNILIAANGDIGWCQSGTSYSSDDEIEETDCMRRLKKMIKKNSAYQKHIQ